MLGSLYELLRGFVAADGRDPERRLQTLARQRPDDLYGGLVTALMRLVFILYAEDRNLMPQDPVYEQHYGLRGLFAKLREDAARHGDLMDRRYGAWVRLLALFRRRADRVGLRGRSSMVGMPGGRSPPVFGPSPFGM